MILIKKNQQKNYFDLNTRLKKILHRKKQSVEKTT